MMEIRGTVRALVSSTWLFRESQLRWASLEASCEDLILPTASPQVSLNDAGVLLFEIYNVRLRPRTVREAAMLIGSIFVPPWLS